MELFLFILEKVLLGLLLAVLLLNLAARRFSRGGNRKRLATLLIAIAVLAVYVSVILVNNRNMSVFVIPAALIAGAAFLLVFKKHVFVFKNTCRECGRPCGFTETLFCDEPVCGQCGKNTAAGERLENGE